MNDHEKEPEFSELFTAFMDGQLDGEDRALVMREIEAKPLLKEQVDLQNRIDDCVRLLYSPPPEMNVFRSVLPTAELEKVESEKVESPLSSPSDSWKTQLQSRKVLWLSLAASIAWISIILRFFGSGADVVAFNPEPLPQVFQQCIAEGFEPYWVCDDDFVFATTFDRRQGVPLKLAELSAGHEMVGLSYLAGVSDRSTSMLAKVDGEPVIVFIDKLDRDWGAQTGYFEKEGLYVHRIEKLGLVLYEVTPFDKSTLANSFEESTIPSDPYFHEVESAGDED